MPTRQPYLCLGCDRRNLFVADTCEAFPDGIPEEILLGYDHRNTFPGDNGITFSPVEEDEIGERVVHAFELYWYSDGDAPFEDEELEA